MKKLKDFVRRFRAAKNPPLIAFRVSDSGNVYCEVRADVTANLGAETVLSMGTRMAQVFADFHHRGEGDRVN